MSARRAGEQASLTAARTAIYKQLEEWLGPTGMVGSVEDVMVE